jgi:hypothetical protein
MNDTRWAREDRIYGLIQLACAAVSIVAVVYLMA